MIVEQWFSTPIGIVDSPKKYELTEYCIELMSKVKPGGEGWVGRPYTTFRTSYNILEDPKFKELNTWVHNSVNEFINTCGFAKVSAISGWFNFYKKGEYQEYHTHPSSHFSCIYYLDTQENDAKTIFHRPPHQLIYNPKENISFSPTTLQNSIYLDSVHYNPIKGRLLIFKSDTLHMVQQKESENIRITISYNFAENKMDERSMLIASITGA